ncbi:MAG TPA: glycoside hydrolase family 130 protein [Bacteroidota bacterium]|nr:glycoside hydrolase family 130 protein [Bacteroidota bacterium]
MILRSEGNPILTRNDVPPIPPHLADVTSVFNPGAVAVGGEIILIPRVQSRSRETFLVVARSADGVRFTVVPEIIRFRGLEKLRDRVYHVYDARITRIGNDHYIMFAMDMDTGCQLGLAGTSDFRSFEFLGITSSEDIRNGVLFPEKIGGRYLRLDRPNKARHTDGPTSGTTIWLSESDDLLRWRPVAPVATGRFHYWDEFIGSGPPPVKTRKGWLHVYHGVAGHFGSSNIYQAGVLLLDLADPSKVVGRSRCNILEPREQYELTGQVPNVVFPSGMVVGKTDAEGFALPESPVSIYYGAADTVVGLATATVQDLIDAAMEGEIPSSVSSQEAS